MPTWGTPDDVKQLEQLFDAMKGFCTRNDIPAFIGEFGVTTTKESASRIRWMSAVMNASVSRRMVPVLWDTGGELSRHEPYAASPDLLQTLKNLVPAPPPDPQPTISVPAPARRPRSWPRQERHEARRPHVLDSRDAGERGAPPPSPTPPSPPTRSSPTTRCCNRARKVPVWGTADPGEAVTVDDRQAVRLDQGAAPTAGGWRTWRR